MANPSESWTFVDGKWHEGAPPIISARTHAFHLGSSVYDGGRAFEGVTPDLDLHCERLNRSAAALGLKAIRSADEILGLIQDGLKRFKSKDAIYIRPMYWAEQGGYMGVPAEPESTRFLIFLSVEPMISPKGFSVTLSPFRRPTIETMPTNAKAGCLYPNNARAIVEARSRGFENALVRDMLGNVCETATSNIFMVKDGVVMTPASNGAFLSGITRSRIIGLLRDDGRQVVERALRMEDFLDADEIFATGNHSKVVPVIRIEERNLQAGPVAKRARDLYWEWAHR